MCLRPLEEKEKARQELMVHRVPLTVTWRRSRPLVLFFLAVAPPPHMVCLFFAFSEHYCAKQSQIWIFSVFCSP